MIFFVFSYFRDKRSFYLFHTNLDLRLVDPTEPALAFLEISQYGHELFF